VKLERDEISLIRTLGLSNNGLHVYTIFRKAGLAAPTLSKALANLQRKEIVELSEEVVSLTPKGRTLISAQPSLLLAPQVRLQDRLSRANRPPPRASEFKGPSIGINEFYVPRTSELPRSLLKAIASAPDKL